MERNIVMSRRFEFNVKSYRKIKARKDDFKSWCISYFDNYSYILESIVYNKLKKGSYIFLKVKYLKIFSAFVI